MNELGGQNEMRKIAGRGWLTDDVDENSPEEGADGESRREGREDVCT